MKYLLKLAPTARAQAVKRLPSALRSSASYKLLGHAAGDVAAKLPGGAGHGAEHVFDVTRAAQRFSGAQNTAIQRRATLGGLLHDVGREAEGTMRDRLGKKVLNQSPQYFHSELGGRYAKDFLNKNRQYAQYVPGLQQGRLSNVIRAHDTDAHAFRKFTPKVLRQDPSAANVYMADKMQGIGDVGANRTISMAKKFNETPLQTQEVVNKNIPKYQNIISNYARTPEQMQQMQAALGQYQQRMQGYYDSFIPKAASFQKGAASMNEIGKLLVLFGRKATQSIEDILKEVIAKNPHNAEAEVSKAIFKLPPEKRIEAMNIAVKLLA